MRVVAIIPSRYESTRFPGKPLAPIAGVPLIKRVYDRVRLASCVTDIAVATDDERIFDAVAEFGGNCVLTPTECRTGSDRADEAARLLELAPDDIVVNVQGDQPLIAPETIEEAVAPLLSPVDFGISTPVVAVSDEAEIRSIKNVKAVIDRGGFAIYFSRSPIPLVRDPGTPCTFYKHLGVYAFSRRFLGVYASLPSGVLEEIEKLEQLRALEYGYKIRVVVTRQDSPSVDLPEDIGHIEALLASR
ncbi:MAG: 3-deoxy-manno-octulosonate cytidylyltransferase [Thermodesulfobacteriota bacterium]